MSPSRKLSRQRHLLQIIRDEVVETQAQLADLLRAQDCPVSQPTLSKDIAELGVVKVPLPNGGHRYQVSGETGGEQQGRRLRRTLQEFLLSWESGGQLLVLKTVAGHAAGVAWAVDSSGWTEIIGTIAGEDTVLIITRRPAAVRAVIGRIEELLAT